MNSNISIYNSFLILLLSLVNVGCMEEIMYVNDDSQQEYIGFKAALTAETRSLSGNGNTQYLTVQEEEWPLFDNEEPTRSSQISSLEGLGVGMYAYKYNSGNCTGNIMNNHSFIFVDNEDLKSADDYVLWSSVGESDIMKVYGYAPRNVSGASLSSTNNIPVITYKVPSDVSSQQDIIATEAKEVKGSYRQNIPLTFRHILTGVRFKAGFDCIVNSVKVENVYSKGNFEIGGVWDNITEKTSFELSFNGGKSCSAGGYITDDAMILMMIPQLLPDDARVTLNYTENGTSGTIQASLKDLIWEKGNLITYTINKTREKDYIYFDLHAGDVIITPDSYSGYVYVNGIATEINGQIDPSKQSDNHYYIYQSTSGNKSQTGWVSKIGDGICRIPKYESVTVGGRLWSDYITNNDNVEEVIEAWDSEQGIISDINNTTGAALAGAVRKVGRSSTQYFINVRGNGVNPVNCNITICDLYSRYQPHGATRTSGGITFKPNVDFSTLTINLLGDNRFGNVHYFSGKQNGDLLENNRIIFQGTGSLTAATVDFYKGTSAQSSSDEFDGDNVYGYFSNYWCSAIGGDDGAEGNSLGIVIKNGTIFAGTTQAENCTALGAGGNDKGIVQIEGGSVTAVASTTGTAIGGGIGFNSTGGKGEVKISGGNVYAYNHGNEWEIPSAAIGSAGSWKSYGGPGTIEITGGYVYAQTALGTAIGGGSSKTRQGGNATVRISGGYVIAKSISAVDKHTGETYPAGAGIGGGTGGNGMATVGQDNIPAYGGAANIDISGNPIIRTGSIGGGKTNNPEGKIGNATISVSGGDITAQFVMAGGAEESKESSFTMTGGLISNSFISDKEYYHIVENGGAVYMEDGTFTMTGGAIRKCTAGMGGAVFIKKSPNALKTPEFYMSGGEISDCVAETNGGAIYLEVGKVTLAGGNVKGNLARNGNGGGVYIIAGDFYMPESGTAHLDDNSALDRGGDNAGNGGGIYVTSSTSDVNVQVLSGAVTNNTSDMNGGGLCVDMATTTTTANVTIGKSGSTNLLNPDISGNEAVMYGGGLYAIGENAKVTINGGRIINNSVPNYVPNENVTNQRGTVVLNGGDVTHVVVTFDGNGEGATVDGYPTAYQNIVTATNSFLVLPKTVKRNFYNFAGWNSRPDGKGVNYTDGQLMNIDKDLTLYAQWIAQ